MSRPPWAGALLSTAGPCTASGVASASIAAPLSAAELSASSSAAASPPPAARLSADSAAPAAASDSARSESDGIGVNSDSVRPSCSTCSELPPPPDWDIPTATVAITTATRATPRIGTSRRVGFIPRHQSTIGATTDAVVSAPRGKPAAARASSSAANSGRGVGRSSRSSANRVSSSNRSIEGLSQLGHGAVQAGVGVGLADPEDGGDLGVAEAGEEFERDQLAVARFEVGERGFEGEPPLGALGARLDRGAVEVGGLGGQLGLAAAAAQLVERRVAGDAEEPGARLAAGRVEAAALAVGALEHQLGLPRSFPRLCDRSLTHAPTTAPPSIHHIGIFPTAECVRTFPYWLRGSANAASS